MKMSMEDLEVDKVTVAAIYSAVVEFGNGSWKDDAALRATGERRVLRKLPESAKTRWTEWKARPDVFSESE